jgi:hypothetical protein
LYVYAVVQHGFDFDKFLTMSLAETLTRGPLVSKSLISLKFADPKAGVGVIHALNNP